MRRLFLLLNLYITMELLICIDQDGLILQIDKSYKIPNYNCTLNSSIDKLINMTSTNGQLTILGTELILTQNVFLSGFTNISIINIILDTQAFTLNTTSDIYLNNSTLLHNCQINSTKLFIQQSYIQQITFQHEPIFKSPLFIDGLIISDSTFFKSTLTKHQSQISNLVIDSVSFINSTLGQITKLSNFTLRNSFIIQSVLIETDILQQITIQNSYFTISTAIIANSSINMNIQNVTLSQSILMLLNSSNQIIINKSQFIKINSDTPLIIATSQFVSIQNTTINQVNSTIFQIYSKSTLIYQLNINQLSGVLLQSNNNVNINSFQITQSYMNNLIQAIGTLSLFQGTLESSTGIFLQSQSFTELLIDQINFTNISNTLLFGIQQSSFIQITNININQSKSIKLAQMLNIINLKILNISIYDCSECIIFEFESMKVEINQLNIQNINNFESILFNIQVSSITLSAIYINNIDINSQSLINLQNNKKIIMNDITLQNINCPYCTGVVMINNSHNINVTKSKFNNITTQQNGLQIQDSTNFQLNNNIFNNITTESCIKVINTSVQIQMNQFKNIYAQSGIVAMDTLQTYYCDLNLYNNCTTNTGKYNYLQTSAIVEPDILTYIEGPVYLLLNNVSYLLDDLIKKNKSIHFNTKSGQQINLQIAILDSSHQKLCNLVQMNINNKIFQFNHINCVFDAYLQYFQNTPLNETVEQLLQFNELQFYNDTFKLPIYLDLKECQLGEEFENQQCLVCPLGSYSLGNQEACKQCRAQVETCPGGSVLVVKAGYWRPNTTTDEIEFCRKYSNNCLGGKEEFTCSQGQTGAICADCDYYGKNWNQSYTRGWNGNCTVCQNDAFNLVKLVLSFLWILIALFFSVRGSLRLVRSQLTAHYLRMMGIFFATRSTIYIDQTEILIKLVSTYFQLISIVLVIQFDFPTPLEFFAQIIGSPLSTLGFSIECFLLSSDIGIEIVYLRQLWNIFISCMIVFLFVFVYLLFKQRENTTSTVFVTCVIQVNFYFQGDIIEGLLQLMFCIKASGQYYIQAATQYLCYTEEYYFYLKVLIIPVLSLVGVVSPIFYVVKLYRFKNKLWTCKLRMPYGYLYVEYKDKYYYWEFVCFFVKSIFYLLETLLISDVKLMFLFAIIVLLIYLELVISHQPYIEKQYNFIDKISTQLAIITLILSYCQDNNPYSWLVNTLSIICSVLNLFYCLYIAIKFIREYMASLKQQHIERIINLFIRYPCLKYFIKKPKNYQSKKKAGLLWRKVRVYVMEFIEKLKLQKSNNNILSGRPNTSSTNTSIGLINSIAPQLLKYMQKYNKLQDRNNSKVYDFQSVVSAYIDPMAESPQLPQKSTVSSIFHYVQQQL